VGPTAGDAESTGGGRCTVGAAAAVLAPGVTVLPAGSGRVAGCWSAGPLRAAGSAARAGAGADDPPDGVGRADSGAGSPALGAGAAAGRVWAWPRPRPPTTVRTRATPIVRGARDRIPRVATAASSARTLPCGKIPARLSPFRAAALVGDAGAGWRPASGPFDERLGSR
jgi:hypothetical protein